MIRGVKLQKLLEQNLNQGAGITGYRNQLRTFLGITENDNGEPYIDNKERVLNAKEVSFQEIAHTFLGRDYADKLVEAAQLGPMLRMQRYQEHEGSVVMPSHFANISAFNDTVAGLIDAMTIEAYQSPEYIGEQFCTVQPSRVNGGAMIGVLNDGQVGDNLIDGQPYPTVGLKETRVEIPENQRRGITIQLNRKVFDYDRTDQIQSATDAAGNSVARAKEIRIADTVQGITNTYERDGKTSNTYRTARGDVPVDFINASTNELVDWNDVNDALQVLEGNTDPGTGYEISIPDGFQILVAPQLRMNSATVLNATTIWTATQSQDSTRISPNPLPPFSLHASRIWYNRLIAAGVSEANAQARWQLGLFKRAFRYRQIVPFQTQQAPLSSEDVRRDIIGVWVCMEHGVPFTIEPRYAYRGTKE